MTRRGRLVVVGSVVAIAVIGIGFWWVSSVRAIGFTGTGGGGPVAMPVVKNTDASSYDVPSDAPFAYGWHRGGYVYMSYLFHNSLHVPITVTGVAPTSWAPPTFLSDPTPYVPRPPRTSAYQLSQAEPLHDLNIAAGADKEIGLLWRVRGNCSYWGNLNRSGQQLSVPVDSVHLSYSVLGILPETQTVPMSRNQQSDGSRGYLFTVYAPRTSQCPVGYPISH
jgi:hypothetical protein